MSNLKSKKALQIANLIIFFATVIVNMLANLIPIGGKNTGELSDALPNLFVPAGITFSIWGVIYVLLGIFSFYQARDLFKKEKIDMPYLDKIGWFFVIANAANIVWIFLWHYQLVPLSLIAMIVLFLALLMVYLRLDIARSEVSRNEKIALQWPISVYLGWITIATIANVTAVLVYFNWDGFGISESIWTILIISTAVIITLGVLLTRKDIIYALVPIWASLGIVIKRIDPSLEPQIGIVITSIVGMVIISLGILKVALEKRKQ
jgi:hypothetical protein